MHCRVHHHSRNFSHDNADNIYHNPIDGVTNLVANSFTDTPSDALMTPQGG